MRFRAGFVVGCAVGGWAVVKVVQLQRPGVAVHQNGSRSAAPHPSVDLTVEKVRALGDLARERLTSILDSPVGETAKQRVTDLIGASLAGVGALGGDDYARALDTTTNWPR
jgi:hypothetical protein